MTSDTDIQQIKPRDRNRQQSKVVRIALVVLSFFILIFFACDLYVMATVNAISKDPHALFLTRANALVLFAFLISIVMILYCKGQRTSPAIMAEAMSWVGGAWPVDSPITSSVHG